MGMVIGIDVGGSTTKIIGVDKEGIKHPMIVKAEDPITSLYLSVNTWINSSIPSPAAFCKADSITSIIILS